MSVVNGSLDGILSREINIETGEILNETYTKTKGLYHGPRKYYRSMEMYDEALIKFASPIGIKLLVWIRQHIGSNYRILINITWLAEDLDTSRNVIRTNLKKLIDNEYAIKEKRNQYFINPNMWWIVGLNDKEWQSIKQDFEFKLNDLKIVVE